MHSSKKVKLSFSATLITVLALATAFGVIPASAHGNSAAGTRVGTTTKGHATFKGTVNLKTIKLTNRKGSFGQNTSAKPAYSVPLRSTKSSANSNRPSVLHAPSVPGPLSSTRPLLHNFQGGSSLDNVANFGFDVEPPDQGLCVGDGFVIDQINFSESIFTTAGVPVITAIPLNAIFMEPVPFIGTPPAVQGDVRCHFDPTTGAFYTSQLFLNLNDGTSHFDIAACLIPFPGLCNVYIVPTTDLSDFGCPCFGDQPLLGSDSSNLYISTNEFSSFGTAFNGAQIYAIDKASVIAGVPAPFVHFTGLGIGGTEAASVQPANNDSAKTEWFLSSLDPNATFDNRIGVWALTSPGCVGLGTCTPVLSNIVITSEVYGFPPLAASTGGAVLNTDDDRMQQVQNFHGALWSSLDTAVTIPGDTGERSGAAYFQISPKLDGSGTIAASAKIQQQGYVATAGQYLLYPAVEVGARGTVAMTMTETSPLTNPSAVYTTKSTSATSAFGVITTYAGGATSDHGFTCNPCRWGDYSAAVIVPGSNNLWIATEFINGSGDAFANFASEVGEVKG